MPALMFTTKEPAMELPILVPESTLITATPEAGRHLAVTLARRIIKFTQPDQARREELRVAYANDPHMLIAISHVVAVEFATIAAANNYWR
jgi:Hexameric tyrosine-coordinated heme protein (HTHP)